MNLPRLGCDLVDVRRLKEPEESFLKGVLTPKERALYEESPDKASFLAGRYVAKEAFLKATGKGLGFALMKELEVLLDANGAPSLLYRGKEYPISISHDGDYAFAIALYSEETR